MLKLSEYMGRKLLLTLNITKPTPTNNEVKIDDFPQMRVSSGLILYQILLNRV